MIESIPQAGRVLVAGICLIQIAAATPPPPPEGKRWILNETFSDEFNGTELDKSKWHDHHPKWRGRPPGIFLPSQVSVGGGHLKISSKKLREDMVVRGNTFNIAGGAVTSKTDDAWFGYYECRFKAAKTTMSTTFWMSTRRTAPGPGPGKDRYGLEFDIQECIGREGDFKGSFFAKGMHSNSHFWYTDSDGKKHDLRAKQVKFESDDLCSDGFNTYGGWWRDESSASFYFNDGEPQHMEFYSEIKEKPFDQKMGLNLVSETYPFPWIELPTDEELDDPARNTCYYDWVRAYVLVDVDAVHGAAPPVGLYEEKVVLDKQRTAFSKPGSLGVVVSYMANADRKLDVEIRNKEGRVVDSRKITAGAGYGNLRLELACEGASREKPHTLSVKMTPLNGSEEKTISVDHLETIVAGTQKE